MVTDFFGAEVVMFSLFGTTAPCIRWSSCVLTTVYSDDTHVNCFLVTDSLKNMEFGLSFRVLYLLFDDSSIFLSGF
jgi:hypothetical protein